MRSLATLTAVVAVAASPLAVALMQSADTSAALAAPRTTTAASRANSAVAPMVTKQVSVGIINYNLPVFEQRTKIIPAITAKYYNWGAPFPAAQILANHLSGTKMLIVLEPRKQNMKRLAAGRYDAYLKTWAIAEKALGLPIILSFAPEMNGVWYPWGKGHITAALYKRAFQHVHNVLLRDGAKHITWMWQVDRSSKATEALSALWPGRSFVNVIGLDGQLGSKSATFSSVFGATYAQVRKFTKVPVMLSEVGIARGASRPKQVTALFASAHKAPLSAVVFFDVGVWNFDKDKATLKAIKSGK
ncbi:MAG TPA: glycosyl hydrolase [Streptosporangiaceae bacterium]|nr:glycosyl hydrolase [Streptosporangiaceae bacterium]